MSLETTVEHWHLFDATVKALCYTSDVYAAPELTTCCCHPVAIAECSISEALMNADAVRHK